MEPIPPAGLRHLNSRDRELMAMPALSRQFPIQFTNGLEIDEVGAACVTCRAPIRPETTFGSVTWPRPEMAVVEAIAVCTVCRTGTPLLVRVKDNGQLVTLLGKRWLEGSVHSNWKDRWLRRWRDLVRVAADRL